MVRHALNYEKDDKGQVIVPPRLQIFSTCTNGIRVIPAQIHDKLKPEDLDTNGEDHWLDALRYKFQGIVKGFEIPDSAMSAEDAAFRAQALNDYSKRP
jgi:hypothetical protein